MNIQDKSRSPRNCMGMALLVMLSLFASAAWSQEGHPLTGSWSGERLLGTQKSRVLLVLELQRDQSFDGYVLERGRRLPIKRVSLDPASWTAVIELDDDAEDAYIIDVAIENLGPAFGRKLVGSWRAGDQGGDFQLEMN